MMYQLLVEALQGLFILYNIINRLSAAIKLKQQEQILNKEIKVCLIEKGSEIGAHILSGNVFDPKGLDELIPNWRNMENRPPINTQVTKDEFLFLLNSERSISIPQFLLPKLMHNTHGNYIISLGNLCRWLGKYAESLGVDIFPGTAGSDVLINQQGYVIGVATKDMGISKNGNFKDNYTPGIDILAKQTIFAEGARGSLAQNIIQKFNLQKSNQFFKYSIGLKEIWEINNSNFQQGLVSHSVGWPLNQNTYGGSFMYHMAPNLLHVGYVVGLSYKNPYLNPYEEFQKFKTHKKISKIFEGGKCISYGSRVINSGGYFSIPKLTFPGGMLVGCSAGFLNVMKIKGSHNAIKSGIIAGETIFNKLVNNVDDKVLEITEYEEKIKKSWVFNELKADRNIKGGFEYGRYIGLINSGIIGHITKGREPWNFTPKKKDSEYLLRREMVDKIEYQKHDGILTFDLLENLQRSGTNHEHDQPSHLKIKPNLVDIPQKSLDQFAGPEQYFCPAKVYEFVDDENGNKKLQINAQNCLHCKTCSIKMINEYIDWTVPEGGGGPNYSGM